MDHQEKHGRPEDLFPIPEDKIKEVPTPTLKQEGPTVSASALETLELFEELMDIEKVAESRNIKPATIYAHLTSCIGAGKVEVSDILDLDASELECLRDTLSFYKEEGFLQLSPVFNGLCGNYSFEILRMIRASN